MRTVTRAAFLALAAAGAASAPGCVREPDPFTVRTDDVAVHVVLVAGAESVVALVETPAAPVPGASVRLIRGQDTIPLDYDPMGCEGPSYWGAPPHPCYRAGLDQAIKPGSAWELDIVLPGGGRVTGSTVVPVGVSLTDPQPGTRLTVRCGAVDTCYPAPLHVPPYHVPVLSMTVRWEQATNPDRLVGLIRPVETYLGETSYSPPEGCSLGNDHSWGFASRPAGQVRAAADSMRLSVLSIFCMPPASPARFDSIRAEALVQVASPEVAAYEGAIRWGSTARQTQVTAGIEGAWGLFGAVTPSTLPLMLIRDPAPAPAN